MLYTDNCWPWLDAELQRCSRGALDVCPRLRLKAALHRERESNAEVRQGRLDLAAFKELTKQRGERKRGGGVEAEGRKAARSAAQFLERRSKKKKKEREGSGEK